MHAEALRWRRGEGSNCVTFTVSHQLAVSTLLGYYSRMSYSLWGNHRWASFFPIPILRNTSFKYSWFTQYGVIISGRGQTTSQNSSYGFPLVSLWPWPQPWKLCQRKAHKIVKDFSHPSLRRFSLLINPLSPSIYFLLCFYSLFIIYAWSLHPYLHVQITLSNLYPSTLTRYWYPLYKPH